MKVHGLGEEIDTIAVQYAKCHSREICIYIYIVLYEPRDRRD